MNLKYIRASLLLLVGASLVLASVWMWEPKMAAFVAGVALVALGLRMET